MLDRSNALFFKWTATLGDLLTGRQISGPNGDTGLGSSGMAPPRPTQWGLILAVFNPVEDDFTPLAHP